MAEELEGGGTATEDVGGGLDMANALDEISSGLGFDSSDNDTDDLKLEGDGEEPAAPKPEGEAPSSQASDATALATSTASAAPKTWRPEAAAEWAKIPPTVQAEIIKREDDIFKGLEGYKELANHGKAYTSVVEPYREILRQANIDPVQLTSQLMSAHYKLSTGAPQARYDMFMQLAKSYHVDLQPSAEAPYEDPAVAALREKLSGVESTLLRQQQREQEAARSALTTEINTFAADPAHLYFDEVASDVAALLRGGGAKDLADAYDKAVWANPLTRAKEQARIQTELGAKAKKEAEEKAAAARKTTAANVKSRSRPASSAASLGSIDDTLQETLSAIRQRA